MAYLLLQGGRVIDPANGIDKEPLDVLLQGGKVVEVGENLQFPQEGQVFDATNSIVCPGLIDMHTHSFPGGTVLGVDPDEWSLKRGVTTVVDAGSTGEAYTRSMTALAETIHLYEAIDILECFATDNTLYWQYLLKPFHYTGAGNFDAFLSYAKTRKTQILFFLHASRIGLEKAGCASDKGIVIV